MPRGHERRSWDMCHEGKHEIRCHCAFEKRITDGIIQDGERIGAGEVGGEGQTVKDRGS